MATAQSNVMKYPDQISNSVTNELERETGLKPATYALARHRSIN